LVSPLTVKTTSLGQCVKEGATASGLHCAFTNEILNKDMNRNPKIFLNTLFDFFSCKVVLIELFFSKVAPHNNLVN
jgi:hypothetical protein